MKWQKLNTNNSSCLARSDVKYPHYPFFMSLFQQDNLNNRLFMPISSSVDAADLTLMTPNIHILHFTSCSFTLINETVPTTVYIQGSPTTVKAMPSANWAKVTTDMHFLCYSFTSPNESIPTFGCVHAYSTTAKMKWSAVQEGDAIAGMVTRVW